ncbi:RecQ family ATP-dependent DNA helicase [Catalinimonas niigatensis]|uniref:RecQ family ATP-dependent DNA helicase n=1 Tax=Catalinimonas niigatensis TaxID=1397264 RepID=UPI0026654CCB|nr:RecQ family ATP-dependent DNA helicase [Catalinimonas niigatensis]WPP51787.1 RecQ family ATP-dependent DNA helicase [Catalinimonas niigatensis]
MKGVAFFDLEVTPKPKEKIDEIGIYFQDRTYNIRAISGLEELVQQADYFCGHNIFKHDIPCLERAGISASFLHSKFIDTLFLSALFFPSKPYHKLVKDYRLDKKHLNNPVEDSKLARDLLVDCLAAFHNLPIEQRDILFELLQQEREFKSFFQLLNYPMGRMKNPEEISQDILTYFKGCICEHADLHSLISFQAVPLAYALALIKAPDTGSVIPPWLLNTYPQLTNVLHQLRASACHKPDCSYCQENLSSLSGLKRYFKYSEFRKFTKEETVPLQQQVVDAALNDESLLAIFPTGGGKSLTFQLPALMKGEASRGLTVVISPLQALMKDQVDVLQKRHDIHASVAINGLLSPLERADAIERVREGGVSLLYISPESLRSNTIMTLLKGRHVERFVIDEAHCFSSWGQDFRVDYLYIGRFIKELAQIKHLEHPIPVSCFTATAKPEVVQDIQQYFLEQNGITLQLYQTTATRTNLSYFASKTEGRERKLNHLLNLLSQTDEPCIVYVSRTKTAEDVAEALRKSGIRAQAFHGKMDSDKKIEIQNSFTSSEANIQVIVATSAFGMGVDKDNVKMVVHYDISDSLENYLQEAGRAGRKEDIQANCHLLFDENDLNEHFALLNQTKLSQKEVGQIWKGIKAFKNKSFTKSALEIAKKAGWDEDIRQLETQVRSAIAALEDAGYVRREQNCPKLFAKSILVRNVEAANKIIRENPNRFPGEEEQHAVRIFQYLISRDETKVDYLADDLGIRQENVHRILTHFKDLSILDGTYELTALINPVRSQNNSLQCFQRSMEIEKSLLNALLPSDNSPATIKIYLRDVNERLISQECESSTIEIIRNLLNYWQHQHFIEKERIDAHSLLYKIKFKEDRSVLMQKVHERHQLATYVIKWLCRQNEAQIKQQQKRTEEAFKFCLVKMKHAIEHEHIFIPKVELPEYEASLLYLHLIEAIKLEGGLFVLYNPMKIIKLEQNPLKQYTRQDYAKLEKHYEKKVEQIHIMGEYARKQLSNYLEAVQFVDDYFRLPYGDFIEKYFRDQKGKLKRPITEEKYTQIYDQLDLEQSEVVRDKESDHILVGAGPGSGKTRVLVHKVAALVMMEDIKPEQFLMLTFSRPAAMEFKERLHKLIGKTAYHIDIYTYHGLAFRLLGRLGDLKKSKEIIKQATEALQHRDVNLISPDLVMRKSVIVVDEYQDISQQEYDFLQTLIELAGEVRVIVVGDDDQNIYEFRGSSVEYMRSFIKDRKAKDYFLGKNYRAAHNLVDFSNQFLELFSAERLKAGKLLMAKREELGQIQIKMYQATSDLVIPLAEDLAEKKLNGKIAVLTRTNHEAVLIENQLRRMDIPVQLMGNQEGFSLRQILELRSFSEYLRQRHHLEQGYISEQLWQECRQLLKGSYVSSTNLELVLTIIDNFGREVGKRKFWSDWLAYLQEIKIEDFVAPDQERVLVSTMHKAKGKEFDHVFLLLNDYVLSDEASKRVIYVAITRAKASLFVHTKQDIFSHISTSQLERIQVNQIYSASKELYLETAMDDVWLGYFKNSYITDRIKALQAGTSLQIPEDPLSGLANCQGKQVVKFSQKFIARLENYLAKGYKLVQAEVVYIIVWYCEEDGKEYRVLLPRLSLSKVVSERVSAI